MEIKNVIKIIKLKFYVKLSSGVLANLPAVLARSSAAASARFHWDSQILKRLDSIRVAASPVSVSTKSLSRRE